MRVSLVLGNFDARARDHLPQAALRERSVFVESSNIEQDMPFRLVRKTLFDQGLDHRNHVGYMLGGTRLYIGR